jgi:hypothetical protein
MPDYRSEQLIQEILEELKHLRQAFEERNRIIDAQIANAPPDPTADQLTTAVNELQQRDLQRGAQATVENWVKITGALYDKGTTYTNVVLIGGYAAFFGLWTSPRSLISVNQARLAAILMIISVSLFVAFEAWKMVRTQEHILRYQRILENVQNETNPDVINQAFRDYEHARTQYGNRFIVGWRICSYLMAATGLLSVLILLCGFISGLF